MDLNPPLGKPFLMLLRKLGVTQSCVTAGIVLFLVLFILSLSLSSGMGGEKEKEKEVLRRFQWKAG
jgi:hypothetical protein